MLKRVLPRSKESAIDAAAAICLFAAAIEVYYQARFNRGQRFWSNVITDLLLLNLTHTALTLVMLAGIPEFKEWIKVKGAGRAIKFWTPMILLTLVFGIGFYFLYEHVSGWPLFVVSFLIVDFIPIHHALMQSKGLSLAKEVSLSPTPRPRDHALHAAYWVLIVSTVLMVICLRFTMRGYMREYAPLFEFGKNVFVVVSLAAIWFLIRRAPRSFFLRLILWPVSAYSMTAALATRAIHGIEYFGVFHQITGASSAKGKQRRAIWVWFGCTMIIFSVISYFRLTYQYDVTKGNGGWLPLIAATSMSLSFVHYYADWHIFRMRHAETRARIGPLLAGQRK